MLVLAVLAAMAFPLAEMSLRRDRERELRRALWEIRDALDAYKRAADAGRIPVPAGASGYPPDLETLVRGVPARRASGAAQPLNFLRRLPRDPFADPSLPAQRSWGLRSHDSPPEQPAPGADVYDVYSRSEAVGLNGVPLREW